jgi:hypothetical protein
VTIVSSTEFTDYVRDEILANGAEVEAILEATDELLADICHRKWEIAGDASPRVYAPRSWSDSIRIHDCTTVTAITANGAPVSLGDCQFEPLNNLDWAGNARPFEQIRLVGQQWPFDNFRATVEVTATWGWPTIPARIKRAALVLGKDIGKHRDLSFGTAVVVDYGALRVRQATLIDDLVHNFRRPEAAAGIGGPR